MLRGRAISLPIALRMNRSYPGVKVVSVLLTPHTVRRPSPMHLLLRLILLVITVTVVACGGTAATPTVAPVGAVADRRDDRAATATTAASPISAATTTTQAAPGQPDQGRRRGELLGIHRDPARRKSRRGHQHHQQSGHRPARLRADAGRRADHCRGAVRHRQRHRLRSVGAEAARRQPDQRPRRAHRWRSALASRMATTRTAGTRRPTSTR